MKEQNLLLYVAKKKSHILPNSKLELKWSKTLSSERANEYLFARAHARYFLSFIYKINPLNVPLFSPPSKAPILKNNLGYISISHCKTAFLIGWSKYPIGVDIESKNRNFPAEKILKKYYSKEEQTLLLNHESIILKEKVLDYWLIKESAFKISGKNLITDLKYLVVNQRDKTVINKKIISKYKYSLMTFLNFRIAVSFDMNLDSVNQLICYSN